MSERRSVSELLREAASRLENIEREPLLSSDNSSATASAAPPSAPPSAPRGRHSVDAEVSRLFGYPRSRRHTPQPRNRTLPTYTHAFCCVARKDLTIVPSRVAKEELQRAGLGDRRLIFRGNQENPREFLDFMQDAFPKLRDGGGFELMKISGTTRNRHLTVIPCPNDGYTISYLKDPATMINHATIYVRPLQRNLSVDPEQNVGESSLGGPKVPCLICGVEYPLAQIRQHNEACSSQTQGERESQSAAVPSAPSQEHPDLESLESGSAQAPSLESGSAQASTSTATTSDYVGPVQEDLLDAWVTEADPKEAAQLFTSSALESCTNEEPLTLTLSMRDSVADRTRSLVCFYKRPGVKWASDLRCKLIGDPAVGEGVKRFVLSSAMDNLQSGFALEEERGKILLFEGEKDHLVPCSSQEILESDLFIVAGRMMAHSFLNGGPRLCGLSPAIVHVLFGGEPDTAPVSTADCVDQDVREVIELLEGTNDLTDEDRSKVLSVSLPWDLPGVTTDNRWWLREKILLYAVFGRTKKQVKQMRRGLKDAGVWDLFSSRPDTVPLLFPRAGDIELTPQMFLEKVLWPREDMDEDSDDEDGITLQDKSRTLGFLRTFIGNGSTEVLKNLLEFWTGWDVLGSAPNLEVTVVDSALPTASTCFMRLKLSKRPQTYEQFHRDLMASISSSYAGFGQI